MDLIGERVRLRAHTEEDAEFFAATLADPEVVQYLAEWALIPYGPREALTYVRSPVPDTVGWTIESRADGRPIGATGLHRINHRNRNCVWGIWIGPPDRWNQGFGTEACRLAVAYAFNHLAMEKVSLDVYEGNARGRRAYEKAGFTREGLLRRHMWLNGRLADVEIMAVFRDHPLYSRKAEAGTE
ncbi:MAG: GNAT family protein [Candidatus Dormiibacterota bacterium]